MQRIDRIKDIYKQKTTKLYLTILISSFVSKNKNGKQQEKTVKITARSMIEANIFTMSFLSKSYSPNELGSNWVFARAMPEKKCIMRDVFKLYNLAQFDWARLCRLEGKSVTNLRYWTKQYWKK